jgi:hypothetical protein
VAWNCTNDQFAAFKSFCEVRTGDYVRGNLDVGQVPRVFSVSVNGFCEIWVSRPDGDVVFPAA